ncbi:MAG TPA: hypothetical protein DEH78_30535, partial [Solibacterales bacterium]|nr:hypothetical protein [Bryobacterales bacterium]
MKPSLLYVTPVVPQLTGNGLAMRAGMVLEALAAHYKVSLLAIPLYPPIAPVPQALAQLCYRTCVAPPGEWARERWWKPWTAAARYRRLRFDVVHVFRLATFPWARPWLDGALCHLDMDDLEPETHRRLAALYGANGDPARAAMEEAEARHAEAIEREALRVCRRVYVCSGVDRARLGARAPAADLVQVLPNAVREAPQAARAGCPADPFPLLFVGTLSYYPNEDAVLHFSRDIAPSIRARFVFQAVGPGAAPRLNRNNVHLAGAVPDVAPWYAQAGAVVAPIRAGGGTRIKILEAFAHGCPVVSTSLAAEGLDVRDGEHLL